MRAVSAGSVLSGELLWWQLLVDASECWASGLKKSFWGSISGAMMNNAVRCRQAQALCPSDNGKTTRRVGNESYAAFFLNIKKLLAEAREGFRSTYKPASASTGESTFVGQGVAGDYRIYSPSHKLVSLDALPADLGWPSNGFFAVKPFKKGRKPHDKTHTVFYTDSYQGLGNVAFQVQTDQAFKLSSNQFASRSYLSGSFGCLKEMHRNGHVLPATSFGRAFSTSTEKQLEEDAGDPQSSVPGPQQSSLGGQQSSLEVPDSKPVSGPSWPNPDNAASYVLMSNIYADGDRWDEVKRINEMRLKARAWKKPGKAYVEIQAKVHEFIVGDRTHQDSANIYEKLRKIKRHMGHIGYVPYVDLVLENRSYYDPYYKPR